MFFFLINHLAIFNTIFTFIYNKLGLKKSTCRRWPRSLLTGENPAEHKPVGVVQAHPGQDEIPVHVTTGSKMGSKCWAQDETNGESERTSPA